MIWMNKTKIFLSAVICNLDNFLINHYYDLNYSHDAHLKCNYLTNQLTYKLPINSTISDSTISDSTISDSTISDSTNNGLTNSDSIIGDSTIGLTSQLSNYLISYFDYENLITCIENLYIYYPNCYEFLMCTTHIILGDILLLLLFRSKGRWFQLHALVNLIIVINILPELINIINHQIYSNINYIPSYYILILHIYHVLTFNNLKLIDYFHHILFVGFGIIPNILITQSNQSCLAYIACMGIPGIIEYSSLALYKNNYINLLDQRKLIAFIYNYFRYPLCVFGVTLNYINYKNSKLVDNFYLTVHLNVLLFINGALFNYLTINSYCEHKNKLKISNTITYSRKNS